MFPSPLFTSENKTMASLYLSDIFRNSTNSTLGLVTDILTAATTSAGVTSPGEYVHGYPSTLVPQAGGVGGVSTDSNAVVDAASVAAVVEAAENVTAAAAAAAVPASLQTTRLVVKSFLTPVVVTIGLFGNLLNILVLFQVRLVILW